MIKNDSGFFRLDLQDNGARPMRRIGNNAIIRINAKRDMIS